MLLTTKSGKGGIVRLMNCVPRLLLSTASAWSPKASVCTRMKNWPLTEALSRGSVTDAFRMYELFGPPAASRGPSWLPSWGTVANNRSSASSVVSVER